MLNEWARLSQRPRGEFRKLDSFAPVFSALHISSAQAHPNSVQDGPHLLRCDGPVLRAVRLHDVLGSRHVSSRRAPRHRQTPRSQFSGVSFWKITYSHAAQVLGSQRPRPASLLLQRTRRLHHRRRLLRPHGRPRLYDYVPWYDPNPSARSARPLPNCAAEQNSPHATPRLCPPFHRQDPLRRFR